MLPEHHIRLALLVADQGIHAHEAELARYAAELRRDGIDSPLLDLCCDRSQPEVARERAFGRFQALLARWFTGEHDQHDQHHDCPAAA